MATPPAAHELSTPVQISALFDVRQHQGAPAATQPRDRQSRTLVEPMAAAREMSGAQTAAPGIGIPCEIRSGRVRTQTS
jgi:hypothetical protein